MWRRIYNWWWNHKHANKWEYVAHLIEPERSAYIRTGSIMIWRPKPIRVKYRYTWPRN